MFTKKSTVTFLSAVFALTAFSSCSSGHQAPMMVPQTTEAQQTEPVQETPAVSAAVTQPPAAEVTKAAATEVYENRNDVFKAGTWFSYSKDVSCYYFFYNDNANGARMMLDRGRVSAFAYELPSQAGEDGIRRGMFHFNTADNNTAAEITMTDSENATVKWQDGTSEKLSFVSTDGIGTFNLYTDEELSGMAVKHYKTAEGDVSRLNRAECRTNEDRSVSIRVYKIMNNDPTKQTTLKWYIVDRHTAEGFVSADGVTRSDTAVDIK